MLYGIMKYRCCECSVVFPCDRAVDGYSMGIKNGFLCPSCNANIKELFIKGGSKRLTFESEQHERWFTKTVVGLVFILLIVMLLSPEHWIVFVATVSVVLGYNAYSYYRWGFVPYPNVIGTEKVEG